MKTEKEIEELANLFAKKILGSTLFDPFLIKGYIDGYTQAQQDMTEKKYIEKNILIKKTPAELRNSHWIDFPTMSGKLFNILQHNFIDIRICDITKKDFLSKRQAGVKSWYELFNITGNHY
jgi:hypothetical protein